MPIYEFECRKCGNRFEVMRRVSAFDEAGPPCTSCRSKRTQRRLSAFSVARGAAPDAAAGDDFDMGGGDGHGHDDFGGGDWDDDDF